MFYLYAYYSILMNIALIGSYRSAIQGNFSGTSRVTYELARGLSIVNNKNINIIMIKGLFYSKKINLKNNIYILKIGILSFIYEIMKMKYDVINIHSNHSIGFIILLFKNMYNIPIIYTIHGLISRESVYENNMLKKIKKNVRRYLQYCCMVRSNHIVTVSPLSKKFIIRDYGILSHNISVIPNGVNPFFLM